MEDLKRAVAVLFRRSGGGALTERDFVLAASMDLRWFPPKDAQRLLNTAVRVGLVTSESGRLRPSFDPNTIEIPLDFVPTAAAFEAVGPPDDLFAPILAQIVTVTGLERKAIVAEVNRVQAAMGITLESAALLVGRAHEVPIEEFIDLVAAKPPSGRSPVSPRDSRDRPT